MFKKGFALILILAMFLNLQIPLAVTAKQETTPVFHGYAEINNELKEDTEVLSNIKSTVEKGTTLTMVVSNILNTENNVEGDEFFAEISSDVKTPNGIVLPQGSVAHGTITEIVDAKRFGRDANITLNFDYIATPDGREIPINAKMTTKRHPVKNAAVITAEHTGYALGGGVVGGLVTVNLIGIAGVAATNGYALAAGAGVGALVGLGIAMSKKGDQVLLAPGDSINVKLIENVNLPVFHEKALKEEEIKSDKLIVNITNVILEKDPFGEPNTITLALAIVNKTNKTFSTFDMALVNENRAVYYASPFGDTQLWFKKIAPNTRIAGKVSFSVDNPSQKLWLVFLDSYSKKPVVKLSLNNAKRSLELNNSKKKKK